MKELNRVIAHRGASYDYPENTLIAFEHAKGYWGCETDIYPTADDHWICLHDPDISQYTNGVGNPMDMTLSQLQSYKIKGKIYKNLTFPTLEEYLAICVKNDLVPVIEVKAYRNQEMLQKLVTTLIAYNLEKKAIISSFEFEVLQLVRHINKKISLLYLTKNSDEDLIIQSKQIQPIALGVPHNLLTENFIQVAHSQKMYVYAWTPSKKPAIL